MQPNRKKLQHLWSLTGKARGLLLPGSIEPFDWFKPFMMLNQPGWLQLEIGTVRGKSVDKRFRKEFSKRWIIDYSSYCSL